MVRKLNYIPCLALLFCVGAVSSCSLIPSNRSIGEASKPAYAQLQIPPTIIVISLDGEPQNASSLFVHNRPSIIDLSKGEHSMTVVYESLWLIDSENHKRVRSKPVDFNWQVDTPSLWRITPPSPISLDEAVKMAETPIIRLHSDSVTIIESEPLNDYGSGAPLSFLTLNSKGPSRVHNKRGYLDQLKYLWVNTPPSERIRFQNWVKQLPSNHGQ